VSEKHYAQLLARPPLPELHPARDAVIFQQIDIDHYIGEHMEGIPGKTEV
jgi:DNA polymerase delta subunit 1